MTCTLTSPMTITLRLSLSAAILLMISGCGGSSTPSVPVSTPTSAPQSLAKFAYVANDLDNSISMYTVSSKGTWTPTSPATVAAGTQPAVVVVDSQGKFAYVSNIRDATIGQYAINQTTGVLTPLSPATAPSGALPQDFTLHPSGNFAYSANSNDGSVTVFSVDRTTGLLTPKGNVALPGNSVSSPIAVTVNPAGTFLYVINDAVQVLAIDATTGGLTLQPSSVYAGERAFKLAFDTTGKFAYVPDNGSSNVYEFSADPATGKLTPLSSSPVNSGNQPAWVAVDPTDKFAYVSNRFGSTVSTFNIAASSGLLTPSALDSASGVDFPWPILFDPSGQILYVLNEDGENVTSYATHSDGTLTQLGTVPTGHAPWSFALVSAP